MDEHRCFVGAFILLLLLHKVAIFNGQMLYTIVPQHSHNACPLNRCIFLSQFATNSSSYINDTTDITLSLLPGQHRLENELSLTNMENLTIMAAPNGIGDGRGVLVECINPTERFVISNVTFVSIVGPLHFAGCGGNMISEVNQLAIKHAIFQDVPGRDSALTINEVASARIQSSIFNTSRLESLANEVSNTTTAVSCIVYPEWNTFTTGGAIVIINSSVQIDSSTFERNVRNSSAAAIFAKGRSNTSIFNSRFLFNTAVYSASSNSFSTVIYVGEDCMLQVSNSTFSENLAGTSVIAVFFGLVYITDSTFLNNHAMLSGGAVFFYESEVYITNSYFVNNSAECEGGAMYVYKGMVDVSGSLFGQNFAESSGGSLYFLFSSSFLTMNTFRNSMTHFNGGAIYAFNSTIYVGDSSFEANSASVLGGAIEVATTYEAVASAIVTAFIAHSNFSSNLAYIGGALVTSSSTLVTGCIFHNNLAYQHGGAIASLGYVQLRHSLFTSNVALFGHGGGIAATNSSYRIDSCHIEGNRAATIGGAVIANNHSSFHIDNSSFHDNVAQVDGGDVATSQSLFSFVDSKFTESRRSMHFFSSNITFGGYTSFDADELREQFQVSGAVGGKDGEKVTSSHSSIYFMGETIFESSLAKVGAAILATSSTIYVHGKLLMAFNTASDGGGGFYLEGTDIEIRGNCTISQNLAKRGGGIYASTSSITIYYMGTLALLNNTADEGGGMYLESNARLYLIKSLTEHIGGLIHIMVTFSGNHAHYGGAMYIADDTNTGACTHPRECPIQTLVIDLVVGENVNFVNLDFMDNSATVSGQNLYGGLLDRCTIDPFAEVTQKWFAALLSDSSQHFSGATYLTNITNVSLDTVSSAPIRVCFCAGNGVPDCSYNPPTAYIKRGELFTLSVIALDHVNHSLGADIFSSLSSTDGGFGEGQQTQKVNNNCTDLTFNVFSPRDYEIVTLAVDGPCGSSAVSVKEITIKFTNCTCPVGFEPSTNKQTSCECICHSSLHPYIIECNSSSGTVSRVNTNAWISYINDSDSFIIHPNCPFDYCYPQTAPISIDFSAVRGSDAQCNFNRAGILCGNCKTDFSLSLGSSHCLPCSRHWPLTLVAVILATAIAGVFLVSMLLVLNLTVADGFINGFIFYANVVAACSSVLFPSSEPSFSSVFIAWLNLDVGFDICLFPGLDAYFKTWLQLAFPVYIISLICVMIVFSRHSTIFARQLGRRDPVATLATLVLLSYTKLLSTTIAILSFADLHYPDGSSVRVWLLDGSVQFFQGKHIPLALVAILIILVGVLYTVLLFCWQWLVRAPKKYIFRWTRNTKVHGFVSTYHAPYSSKYRYWTGLLLFVRVLLYITLAVTQSGSPQVPLIAINVLIGSILFLRVIGGDRVYSKPYIEFVETALYINLLYYSTLTLYDFGNDSRKQTAITYMSTSITFIFIVGAILRQIQTTQCHLYSKRRRVRAKVRAAANQARNKELQEKSITFSVVEINHSQNPSPRIECRQKANN